MPRHAVATEPDAAWTIIEIVTLEQAQKLVIELGGHEFISAAGELRAMIDEAGTRYRWALWMRDEHKPQVIRAQLDQLSRDLGSAIASLDRLGALAAGHLCDELDYPFSPATYRRNIERLRRGTDQARDALPRGSKPALTDLRVLCWNLSEIYECWTVNRFTYDSRRALGAKGETHFTPAGMRWVEQVARLIDPEVTQGNLSTAMRDLRKPPSK